MNVGFQNLNRTLLANTGGRKSVRARYLFLKSRRKT